MTEDKEMTVNTTTHDYFAIWGILNILKNADQAILAKANPLLPALVHHVVEDVIANTLAKNAKNEVFMTELLSRD
jgi:hypothetical protein